MFKNYLFQLLKIIPFWLSGIAMGAYLKTYHSTGIGKILIKISGQTGTRTIGAIFLASAFGAISPITLFGIIPLLSLFNSKQNRQIDGILLAFITSSILISPNIFIFTLSLGLDIAIMRVVFSIVAGVIIGLIVALLPEGKDPVLNLKLNSYHSQKAHSPQAKKQQIKPSLKNFGSNFTGALRKTGINLAIGMAVSLGLYLFIPDSLWEFTFQNSNLAVPISAVLSVGLYQCGGGSIPIIQEFLHEGLPVGAALTFMMMGPFTKMTNLAALKTILSLRNLIAYSLILLVYILIIGWITGV